MTKSLIRYVYIVILGMKTITKMALVILSHEIVIVAIVTLIKQACN